MKKLLFLCLLSLTLFTLGAKETGQSTISRDTFFEIITSDKTEEEICNLINTKKYSKKIINEKDENGYTSLFLAIDADRPMVLELLIKKGANKNITTDLIVNDKSGRKILRCSPVLYAAWKGKLNCLQLLLEKGSKHNIEADIIVPAGENSTYLRLLMPVDAAFYNRNNIDFNETHKILASKNIDYEHIHFTGKKWAYTRIKTSALLKEYDLLEIK